MTALLFCAASGASLAAASMSFFTVQEDGRNPVPWQTLDQEQSSLFDLGHAVFNSTWVPAHEPAGRRDGLGPLFNAPSCDACHNSRRRGRGPTGDGEAPSDLVVKAGRRLDGDGVERRHPLFGQVINTVAIEGFLPEARISIHYQVQSHVRADGSAVDLHVPHYTVVPRNGASLPPNLVVMPRTSPAAHGAGLLEEIPEHAIMEATGSGGEPSWVVTSTGRRLGRYGWQATEPTLASQIASAFANEMGLTTPLLDAIDCGDWDLTCRSAPNGGVPEVSAELFDALLAFQRWETVRRTPAADRHLAGSADGARLFAEAGCAGCHRPSMPLRHGGQIAPYTDLLLHDLGPGLADRDVAGTPVVSRWRSAPLWGMSTALEGGRPVRLLHDGRARSIEEAIAWHDGTAAGARARFDALDAADRQRLIDWISAL